VADARDPRPFCCPCCGTVAGVESEDALYVGTVGIVGNQGALLKCLKCGNVKTWRPGGSRRRPLDTPPAATAQ
jgi:hypothetical protein